MTESPREHPKPRKVTGLSQRGLRRMVAEKLPGRRVSEDAILSLKASLDQTAYYILTRAAEAHDQENVVREQIGARPKVRLSSKHIRIALCADTGQDEHA